MSRTSTKRYFSMAGGLSLLCLPTLVTAVSLTIESGKWHLLSLPGASSEPFGDLFAAEPANESVSNPWFAYTYNSAAGEYRQVDAQDQIDTTQAFWFYQRSGEALTVDLSSQTTLAPLQNSSACASSNGCIAHELSASGTPSWTLIGAPFPYSIPISQLRLVSDSEQCAAGCTIPAATEAGLTNGRFLGYNTSTGRYETLADGDTLQPGMGYWFFSSMQSSTGSAVLLIPAAETGLVPDPVPEPEPASANLLFKSGFESGVTLSEVEYGYQRLNGIELESGFLWDETLNGLWGSSNNGIHLIDGGGQAGAINNELQTVTGRSDVQTTALYQEITFSDGSPRAQTPYQINTISDDPAEFYISYWMKIDANSLNNPDQWRIIWQYKTDRFDYQHPEPGYRISIYIYTDENGPYWHVKGDDQRPDYWSVSDRDTPVPRDEWFRVEVYGKVSSGDDGRFRAMINSTEIASHDGPNLGSAEDSMAFMMLWQLYGNSYPAHQWIDDVEIWDGVPY